MFDLTGRVALITGATGGIGAEIAKSLHAQGAKVILTGTRQAVLDDMAGSLGGRCHAMTANLSDREDVANLADRAAEAAGKPVEILVNNAGITRDGLMMRMKDEDWDAVMEVNLTASMILSRSVLRGMMKNRWGADYSDVINRWLYR